MDLDKKIDMIMSSKSRRAKELLELDSALAGYSADENVNGTSEPTERGWMCTYTGKKFYPLDPRSEDVDIIDIAHHLSNICRYTGACREFYSVAQHCVMGSYRCTTNPFHFLMHDAAEAYINDLARPIKYDDDLYKYREAELRLDRVILSKFGIKNTEKPTDVAEIDYLMCVWEGVHLMPLASDLHWTKFQGDVKDWPPLVTWAPYQAELEFLGRFHELYRK